MKTDKAQMTAVIIGAVESTQVAIAAFARSDWNLALVVTLPPEAHSRHSDYVDLGPDAAKAGAALHHTRQVNNAETIAAIRAVNADYIFVIGWSQICGPEFCAIAPGRTVGYHPAAIPRLRGRAVIPWTILLDEKITAGSLFWIDDGVDSGPLLAQEFFHVAPDECAESLYAKHMQALASMMDGALVAIAGGSPLRKVQDERCATYATKRTKEDGLIDWCQPAVEIDRLVRAVGRPYPGAFIPVPGGQVTIWRSALPADGPHQEGQPGEVVEIDGASLTVATGDGLLRLEEWEGPEGYRPVKHAVLGN